MRLAPAWAPLSAGALGISLVHTLIDWHIGLFGATADELSAPQAALVWATAALYGWWGWSLVGAAAGGRAQLASVLVLDVGWALAGNGLVIAACPPPCPGGFPHQDIAHLGSLALGAAGGAATWRALRERPGRVALAPPAVALGLLVAAFALQGMIAA